METAPDADHRDPPYAVLNVVDRLIVMDKGRIVADGPRDEILAGAGLS